MVTIACLDCQHQINLGSDPEVGQQVICQLCNTILEITWLFPISLDYPEIKVQLSPSKDDDLG